MKEYAPVNIILYSPKEDTNKQELAKRVAQIHTDTVTLCLNRLRCPAQQKRQLLDAIIETAKQANHPESHKLAK